MVKTRKTRKPRKPKTRKIRGGFPLKRLLQAIIAFSASQQIEGIFAGKGGYSTSVTKEPKSEDTYILSSNNPVVLDNAKEIFQEYKPLIPDIFKKVNEQQFVVKLTKPLTEKQQRAVEEFKVAMEETPRAAALAEREMNHPTP